MKLYRLLPLLLLSACYSPWAKQAEKDEYFRILFMIIFFIGLVVGAIFLFVYLAQHVENLPNLEKEEIQRRVQAEAKRVEQLRLDDLRTVPRYPEPEEFAQKLYEEYWLGREVVINSHYLPRFLDAAKKIYTESFVPPEKVPSLEDPFKPYDLFFAAMLQGLNGFTDKASEAYTQRKDFVWPKYAFYTEEQTPFEAEAYKALAAPFANNAALSPYLPRIANWNYVRGNYEPQSTVYSWDEKERRREEKEHEKALKEYRKFETKMIGLETPMGWALQGSPWYTCQQDIAP